MDIKKFKVLVVDDVSSARKSLYLILRQMGIVSVTEARSSKEALEKLNEETFQLVISDWEMPEISGLELLKKVKSSAKCKDIPFIMLTSSSEKTRVLDALKAGVSDYAVKPVSLDIISTKIMRVFSPSPAK